MRTSRARRHTLPVRKSLQSRRITPIFELFENRQLLASGFLQGTVFLDSAGTGKLEATDAYQAGASVQLFDATNTQVGTTQITGADGAYRFDGLTAGDYTLVETPPTGFINTATQSVSPINPVLAGGTTQSIKVHVVDPSTLTVNYDSRIQYGGAYPVGVVNYQLFVPSTNSYVNHSTAIGPIPVTVTSTDGTTPLINGYCVDPFHELSNYDTDIDQYPGPGVPANPTLDTNLEGNIGHSGQIAYIINHYSSTTDATTAEAVSLAIRELQFDTTADFNAGNYKVSADPDYSDYTTPDQLTAIETVAYSLINASIGKSEQAYFLDSASVATLPQGSQGLVIPTSLNFGNGPASSISGYVYADTNNDGIKDATEAPIPNTTVSLTGIDDLGHSVTLSTVTDNNGLYSFDTLRPGTYVVTETQPANYLDGKDTIGTPGGTTGNDVFSSIVLPSATNGTNNNFGELKPGSLSGFVYFDSNNDGLQSNDTGNGISGVLLTLTGTNDLGAITTQTTNTASDGSYSFTNLRPGTYTVTETQPAGYVDGKDALVNIVIANSSTTDVVSGIAVTQNANTPNNNFGELKSGSLSGFVYFDSNNDGFQSNDTGNGISGVLLTLTGTNDLGAITSQTTNTVANGSYSFTNLRPGTYTVTETQPAGYVDGKDALVNVVIANSSTTDVVSGIAVTQNANTPNNNFGELKPGCLSGFVYVDANNDGIRVASDTPISGVLLTLTGTNDLGAITTRTTNTASDGSYSFTNLRPGTYTVTETQPAGYIDGKDALVNVVIANSSTTDVVSGIAVTQNANTPNNNFGELKSGSLSGFVYFDSNNDGLQSNDTGNGISGVLLTLTGTNDLGAITSQTTNTVANGSYSFTNLRPGTYTVTETQPAGYVDGKDALVNVVIANSSTTDVVSGIAVTQNANTPNNNFGELKPGTLSGFVYVDANNDGIRVASDTPISGVLLTLTGTNDLGAITTRTTNTASDGSYSFTNLRPGTYTVTETQPAGYIDGKDALVNVVIPNSSTTDVVSGIAVTQNANTPNNNFGELVSGTISGHKYLDATGNGLTAGQAPIAGVQIQLYADTNHSGSLDTGDVVTGQPKTTDSTGAYSFTGLAAGTYFVKEIVPAGWVQTGPNGPAANNYYTVTVPSTGAVTASTKNDFADFELDCDPSDYGCVTYKVNGCTVDDLSGNTHQGDVVSVTFNVNIPRNTTHQFSLVSYTAPGSTFSASTASQQVVFDEDSELLGPGVHTLTVQIPNSFYQVDFVCGAVIDHLGQAGSNLFYHAQQRYIDSDNGGYEAQLINPASLSGQVFIDTNSNGNNTGDAGLAGVTVRLTHTDSLHHTVTLTRVTDSNGQYSFNGLQAGTYTITEVTPANYTTTKNAIGKIVGKASSSTDGHLSSATTDAIDSILLAYGNDGINYNFGELKRRSY